MWANNLPRMASLSAIAMVLLLLILIDNETRSMFTLEAHSSCLGDVHA